MTNFLSSIKGFFDEKFPLAKKVVSSTPSAIKKGFSLASDALSKGAEDTSKLSFGQQAKRDLVERPLNIAKFVFDANKFLIQAPLQAATRVGLSAIEKDTGKPQSVDLKSPVAKALFGTDRLSTFQSSVTKGKELVSEYGGSGLEKKIYPAPLVAGSIALDLLPGGSGKKKATDLLEKEAKSLFESVVKETNPDVIENVLRKEYKGLSDDTYKSVSNDLARTQDGTTVYDTLKIMNQEVSEPAVIRRQVQESFDAKKYIDEQVAAQKAARGVDESIVGSLKKKLSEVKPKLVDFTSPVTDVLKRYKAQITPSTDINDNIDRVLRSNDLAGQFIEDKGLKAVIQNIDDTDAFNQYLIARHAIDLDTMGIKTSKDVIKSDLLVKALAEKYEPVAQQVTQYSRELLKYVEEAGIISKETADNLNKLYPNYVPFNRIFSDAEIQGFDIPSNRSVANLSKQSVIRKIEGSEREVENPLESFMKKTIEAFEQGEKNKAARQLVDYKDLPGNPFDIKPLKEGAKVAADRGKISVYKDGVRELYDVPKYVEDMAKALKVQQIGFIGRVLAALVRIARVGITGIVPAFVLANLVRDQIFTAITGTKGFKESIINPQIFMRALTGAIKHNDDYKEMVRMAAGGTSFDMTRNSLEQTVQSLRAKKDIVSNIKYTVTRPRELLRAVEDIIARGEEITRLQQYLGTKEYYLKQGMNAEDAARSAAIAARENSVNFARRGEFGTVLSSTFLYLNAGIQGSRRLVRELNNAPVQTSAKIATVIMMPVAISTAYNLSDEKRKAVYDDIAEYEKENNIIIVPPNAEKGEDGKWNVIKIPLPPGVGSLSSLPRKAIEMYLTGAPIKGLSLVQDLVKAFSPIGADPNSILSTLIPQAIKPTVQYASNYNFFTELPSVSPTMSKLSPELQYKDSTSGTARKLAGAVDASPIKVENFIKDTFGRLGSYALNASDRLLSGAGIIPEEQIGGVSISKDIVNRFGKATGGELDRKTQTELVKLIQKQDDERFMLKQEAELVHADLMEMTDPIVRKSKANEIKRANPTLYAKMLDVKKEEEKGLTYADRLVASLGVENGARSEYIAGVMADMTSEERNAYAKELKRKGILSDKVDKQLRARLNKLKAPVESAPAPVAEEPRPTSASPLDITKLQL